MEAKRAGQKDKALRILTDIKSMKMQVAKTSGYTTIMMKNLTNLDSVEIDSQMADIFEQTVS